ncbi:cytochrome P450 [Caenimonas soli]|uniref:cytochrome P450 n=1 Tax=Caenimonas soli TaxID=2735555 RepID=UPI002E282BBA|nr:cytochrome P450 [Caenimonas soli]
MRRLADLPSPKGLPLIGNVLQLESERLHLILEGWCKELGSTYTIALGPRKAFVCSDPELLQTALRERPERYRRYSPIESVIKEMGANGVFSVEGEAWRPQRRLIMQALASTHFRAFFPTLQAITERLYKSWRRAAAGGEVVDMTHDLVRYTVDVTTALAFGEDPNTIDQSGNAIQDHLALIFPMLMVRINAPFPLWRYVKLPRDHRFERSLAAVKLHIDGLIERARRRRRDEPAQSPRNVLEAMLVASDEPNSGITDAVISANVMTLLLAGEDTTAHTLAWTMPFLCADPQLQARLHDAAAEVLGAANVCPSFEDLRRLDLFEACAHEATRLKPIVPLIFLEPLEDVVLGDVALPAGTPLFFVLRPAMVDEAHFGRPELFLPQRWATGHEAVQPHDTRAYAQFGAGPRMCPGRHLAGVELRLVLSMLARNFSMELAVDRDAIKEVLAFTMMPSTMPVRLKLLRSQIF